jgi:hypothetical protein
MEQLHQNPFRIFEFRPGGRISSPKLRKSLEDAEDFAGLEEGVNRYDLLLLVKKVGKGAGFTSKMIHLLDYYMSFTRDIDWEQGSRPIVYQSLSRTALDLGVSERQIQNLEKALFGVGAITWNDSGNHKRYGRRNPETGELIYAYGVDLTPLAYLKAELSDKLAEKQLYDEAWLSAKREISQYRRHIKAIMYEVIEREGEDTPSIIEIERAYEGISLQIRSHMKLESLLELKKAHIKLYNKVLKLVDNAKEDIKDKTSESSCRREENCTHYKSTTLNNNTKNSSRAKLDANQKRSSGELEDYSDGSEVGEGPSSSGIEHISIKQVLGAASDRLKAHFPINEDETTWNDVIEGAYKLKSELNISQKSWGRACQVLGRSGAAICILLTDQGIERADDPVRMPAAYFNGMIAKAEAGELHLHASIFGILERE